MTRTRRFRSSYRYTISARAAVTGVRTTAVVSSSALSARLMNEPMAVAQSLAGLRGSSRPTLRPSSARMWLEAAVADAYPSRQRGLAGARVRQFRRHTRHKSEGRHGFSLRLPPSGARLTLQIDPAVGSELASLGEDPRPPPWT